MLDPILPPHVSEEDAAAMEQPRAVRSPSVHDVASATGLGPPSPATGPMIDASGRVIFADAGGEEDAGPGELDGEDEVAGSPFGYQPPVTDNILEEPALELEALQGSFLPPAGARGAVELPWGKGAGAEVKEVEPREDPIRLMSRPSEAAVKRMSEVKVERAASRSSSHGGMDAASRSSSRSAGKQADDMDRTGSLSWWGVAAGKPKPKLPPPPLNVPNTTKTPHNSLKLTHAGDGQYQLIDEQATTSDAPEEDTFTTATAHYIEKSKAFKEKHKQLEARNKEFMHNKTSADILAKVRLGYISISEFMTHYSKMDQKEKTALIQRLVPSTLRTHSEVDRQVRLVEFFTEMQEETKNAGQLEDLLQRVAKDVLHAAGAKVYLVDEERGRVDRLNDSRLSCSYFTEGPRMCIIQAAAQSRMPVTINNAWSHHHYNDKWDGPKARSLMCLPMWKNAEPREGEMIGILHIYRGNEEKFTRSDETIARMVALVAGPTLEQLVHVNELASQHEVGPDNARLLNEYGTRCISLALNDSMSAASCRTEMLQLTRDAEKLASIAVNASACSIYFLDNTEKSLFAARAKRTARGQLHEHFHLVHAMAGEVCTSGKPVRVDLDALKDERASVMGRADRLRERFENERLRNVIVVPMFAPPRDAAAIRTFALGLKPAAQLAVEDTDVLRVHIATETRRPPRKSKLLNNTVLSRWAGMRFEDDTNKRQLVGVVQVSNAVLEHTKGAAGGRRMFLDEDQEVLKEVVDFIVQMISCILRRYERQVELNRAYKLADKLEELAWVAPQIHASIEPTTCAHIILNHTMTLMNGTWARLYVLTEMETTLRFDARTVQVFSTVAGEEDSGGGKFLMLKAPPLLREAFHSRSMTRARSSEIEEGGSWVQGVDTVGGRVTSDVICIPLPRTQAVTGKPGGKPAALTRFVQHTGDPLAAVIGALMVGTFRAESSRVQGDLAAEAVFEELAQVAGMAVTNFLKASLAAGAQLSSAEEAREPPATKASKSKRAIKFDDEV